MRQKYKLVKVSGIYYMFKSNFDIRIDGTARSIIVSTTGLTNTRGEEGSEYRIPGIFFVDSRILGRIFRDSRTTGGIFDNYWKWVFSHWFRHHIV